MKTIHKSFKTYQEAVDFLNSSKCNSIKPGLDRINVYLDLAGNPHKNLPCIHIAGTNGKGSVLKYIETVLTEAGYKVGSFTSPHLIDFTERITLNGTQISQEDFLNGLNNCIKILNDNSDLFLTTFEILTAMAFEYFKNNKVNIALLEVGMGGTYDSTNVIENPLINIITEIGLDHTEFLGTTIKEIAIDKAGTIKKDSFVVINRKNKAIGYILQQTKEKEAYPFVVYRENYNFDVDYDHFKQTITDLNGNKAYSINMPGEYQQDNVLLALKTIELLREKGYKIPEEAVISGLEKTRWLARAQYFKKENILIDGAHNPDGAKTLRKLVDDYFKTYEKIWILGILATKDYKSILNELVLPDETVVLTQIEGVKSIDDEELYRYLKTNYPENDSIYKSSNLKEARIIAKGLQKDSELIILTGSLYLAGEYLKNISKSVYI